MGIKKLLCLGDSLIQGYEIEMKDRWTELLSAEVNYEILNYGISGDTTTGMLARCEQLLINHKPSHFLVMGGTNDLWFGLKDEFIISNIHAMTRQARFHKAQFIIGIPTLAFNLNELNLVGENYSECIRSFRNALVRYCTLEETPYIDFSKNMTADMMLYDGVHPNKKGQELMKELARDFLKQNH